MSTIRLLKKVKPAVKKPKTKAQKRDKCSGHCISNKPGTLGHHDNREPLY